MQVILSRKGFDSKNGGQPSPILPDGTLLSLPIAFKGDFVKFTDLSYNGKSYFEIIKELNPKSKIKEKYLCHVDPDIRQDARPRANNWKPLFGQVDSAGGHLINKKVKKGDLFLFFGWFRETEQKNGTLIYKKGAPDLHIIFGYLLIDSIYTANHFPQSVSYHTHAKTEFREKTNNLLFEAADNLPFAPNYSGGGCFEYNKKLVLTKEGFSRSRWDLPPFFKELSISYHSQNSFKKDYFDSAKIGQEFVIQESESLLDWVKEKFI